MTKFKGEPNQISRNGECSIENKKEGEMKEEDFKALK